MPTASQAPVAPFRALRAAVALLFLVILAACGSGNSDPGPSGQADAEHTIEHAYGTTEVPAHPKRVVALGWTDVENAIAVGVTPVVATDWFGTGKLNPWVATLADGQPKPAQKEVSGDKVFDFDAILAAEPDLIFANDNMTKDQYERLSQIAPTVGPIDADSSSDHTVNWQVALERTGRILGRENQAAEVERKTEEALAKVRAAHPEYAKRTVGIGFPPAPDAEATLATVNDARMRPLLEMGFQPSKGVKSLDPKGTGMPYVSEENLSLLEADILFLYSYTPEFRTDAMKMPLFARLDVVRDGRVVWLPSDVADALTFGTAPALQYAAQKVPALVAKVPLP